MKPLRVAIVAAAHGWHRAPFHDKDWECWGLNTTWAEHEAVEGKFHRWFELHRRAFITWEQHDAANAHVTFLRSLRQLPVYVQKPQEWSDVLTARAFPFAEVQGLAPRFGYYHACSIDWMLAYAITLKAKEIRLCGVEQQHTAEPLSSRACLEFWAGFATARGIRLSSEEGSTFKLAHLTYTDTPYALDPAWLPFEDRTNGGKNRLTRAHQLLEGVIADE